MSKKSTYPRSITVGSATVKIYRVAHSNTADGWLYTVAWRDTSGTRKTRQFADEDQAEKEAKLIAGKISSGNAEAAGMNTNDRNELLALRALARGGVPVLSAMQEWATAWELTGGRVIDACKAFAAANGTKGFKPILAEIAVEKFIAARTAAGKDAERTYGSKLAGIKTYFVGRELHTISTAEWQQYLAQWSDGTTHNDYRKKTISLCRWARNQGYIPRGLPLEIELTEKREEKPPEVGIIMPETYGRLLRYLHVNHSHYLAAAVLAGMCGIRSDEIHGRREDDREKRQLWSDIHIDGEEPLVVVSNAKSNTPSWRTVPLCPAAIEWLKLCPEPRDGYVCDKAAMERIRDIGITAGLNLPDNCFRHSYISYQMILTGNKHTVSHAAGNSPERIDHNYRRPVFAETGEAVDTVVTKPVTKAIAQAWFAMTPAAAEALPHLQQKTPEEIGRLGGLVKSEKKTAAVRANLENYRSSRSAVVGTPPADPISETSGGEADDAGIDSDVRDSLAVDSRPE